MVNTNAKDDNTQALIEMLKADVECLRKVLKEKDELIEELKQQLEAVNNDSL